MRQDKEQAYQHPPNRPKNIANTKALTKTIKHYELITGEVCQSWLPKGVIEANR